MERRNNFKSWFMDVGMIYLIVAAAIVAIFVVLGMGILEDAMGPESADDNPAERYIGDSP